MRYTRRLRFAIALVIAFLVVSCNNSPTVPLPPPDMTIVTTTTPDENGVVTVAGREGAVDPESVVLLFNETAEFGVMEESEEDGSFETSVAASPGDSLTLQYKLNHEVSAAAYISVE